MKEDKWYIVCHIYIIQGSIYVIYAILYFITLFIDFHYNYKGLTETIAMSNALFTMIVVPMAMFWHVQIENRNTNLTLLLIYNIFKLIVTLFMFISSTIVYSLEILPSSIYSIVCTLNILHLITLCLIMRHTYIMENKTFRCCSDINEEAKNELNENKSLL